MDYFCGRTNPPATASRGGRRNSGGKKSHHIFSKPNVELKSHARIIRFACPHTLGTPAKYRSILHYSNFNQLSLEILHSCIDLD